MGLQEIIAAALLIAAILFLFKRFVPGLGKKPSGTGCDSCGSNPSSASKSKMKA